MNPSESASHFDLINNAFTEDMSGTRGLEILSKKIIKASVFDTLETFDHPRCHEETRKAVLDTITSWADARPDRKNAVFWLHGPAGAGKSAIVQTIGERFHGKNKLAASFFFSRFASGRNTVDQFFTTIAHQLAISIPALRDSIVKAVEINPTIFSSSLETQMKTLIVDPLHTIGPDMQLEANIVIIDGLDECRGIQVQREVLQVIWDALFRYNIPLYFLLASRPEPHLQEMFRSTLISEIYIALELNCDLNPDDDIKLYLECNFRTLMGRQDNCLTFTGLSQFESVIDVLIHRSSGQFIYPSTVLKFIEDPTKSPNNQLSIVLGASPSSTGDHPLAPLDALYTQVLSNTTNDLYRIWAKRVLGAFIILQNQSPRELEIRELEIYLSLEPGSVRLALSHLQSVVHVPDANSSQEVSFYHSTFSEYLLNSSRSQEHFVDIKDAFKDLFCCYLHRWDEFDCRIDTEWSAWLPYHSTWFFTTINERGFGEFLEDLDGISNISSLIQSMDVEDPFTKQVQQTLIFTFVHQLDEYSKDTGNGRSIYEKYVTALDQYHFFKLQNYEVQSDSLKDRLPHALACQGNLDLLEALRHANRDTPTWDPELLPGLSPELGSASSGYYERFFSDPLISGSWSIGNKTYYNVVLEHLKHSEDDEYTSIYSRGDFADYILFILQKATLNLSVEEKDLPDDFHPARVNKLCAMVDEKCRDKVKTLLMKVEFHEECERVSRVKVIGHGVSAGILRRKI